MAAADAWADPAYVLFGDSAAAGLPAVALFEEVHDINMTKEPDSSFISAPPEVSYLLDV